MFSQLKYPKNLQREDTSGHKTAELWFLKSYQTFENTADHHPVKMVTADGDHVNPGFINPVKTAVELGGYHKKSIN